MNVQVETIFPFECITKNGETCYLAAESEAFRTFWVGALRRMAVKSLVEKDEKHEIHKKHFDHVLRPPRVIMENDMSCANVDVSSANVDVSGAGANVSSHVSSSFPSYRIWSGTWNVGGIDPISNKFKDKKKFEEKDDDSTPSDSTSCDTTPSSSSAGRHGRFPSNTFSQAFENHKEIIDSKSSERIIRTLCAEKPTDYDIYVLGNRYFSL